MSIVASSFRSCKRDAGIKGSRTSLKSSNLQHSLLSGSYFIQSTKISRIFSSFSTFISSLDKNFLTLSKPDLKNASVLANSVNFWLIYFVTARLRPSQQSASAIERIARQFSKSTVLSRNSQHAFFTFATKRKSDASSNSTTLSKWIWRCPLYINSKRLLIAVALTQLIQVLVSPFSSISVVNIVRKNLLWAARTPLWAGNSSPSTINTTSQSIRECLCVFKCFKVLSASSSIRRQDFRGSWTSPVIFQNDKLTLAPLDISHHFSTRTREFLVHWLKSKMNHLEM